jgi:DNA primase
MKGEDMAEEIKKKKEIKDYVEAMIDSCLHRTMGRALDLVRISEMSDRSMEQFSRHMKDYVNELETYIITDFKSRGIIKE